MLIQAILDDYRSSTLTKATYATDTYIYHKLSALWGTLEHTSLTIGTLRYKELCALEVSAGTVRRELSLIKRAWRYAQSLGAELTDLFDHFRMPPSAPARVRIPTDRDLKLIARRCSPVVSALVRLGLETGMWRNEMLAIERNDVDFANRTLYIPHAKTGSRVIPLSNKAVRILKQWSCNFEIKPNSVTQNFRRVCGTVKLAI